ncbi:MAG: cytochrome c [Gammaproteobacteria bacterium]|nr:cytochrome c [Gammaproteobacteria bacterium]
MARAFLLILILAACSGCLTVIDNPQVMVDGRSLYERECLACHMSNGGGVPGMAPPLVGSPWVAGGRDALVGYVLTGGFSPQVLMSRFDFLSDQDMSVLLTYVRKTFGENGTTISTDQVARIRSEINTLN